MAFRTLLTALAALSFLSMSSVSPGWADTQIDVGIPAGGAADLLQYKGTVPPGTASDADSAPSKHRKVRLSGSCTDGSGVRYKENEPGYGGCVANRASSAGSGAAPASGAHAVPGSAAVPSGGLQLGTFGD